MLNKWQKYIFKNAIWNLNKIENSSNLGAGVNLNIQYILNYQPSIVCKDMINFNGIPPLSRKAT